MLRSEDHDEYVRTMGVELGTVVALLSHKLIELQIVWNQYRQLFGEDEDTVHLLNRTAGLFFQVVQDQLWDSVLIGISKMTDPASTGKKRNLTLYALPDLIEDVDLCVIIRRMCIEAETEAQFARDHRNKRIAHEDHLHATDKESHALPGVSREAVENMLESIRAVLNTLNHHYRDTEVCYQSFVDYSGGRLLVSKLRKLEWLEGDDVARAEGD